ncbi:myotubularin-related protein 10-B isoform X2 [Lingula anatina]|uniref:Myotubularin-related protein 10-B isoform X2 n=1 Tax=Lingula anatina TaxID=7574 RepID=A0A1S3I2C1_LINAN|nr:myotubularin-related protein 10-B isoform X2 [Lingula anatina]|eukprot:XP_013392417.1 myotubularin-related protein 10-B isoform X2 [Lingula anatina]
MSKGFKIHVDIFGQEEQTQSEIDKNAVAVFQATLEPQLLPGELIVGHAQNVLKFSAYSEQKQGISGSLFCTNFKVSFVTADRSSYDGEHNNQRNLLLGENDIALCNIDDIYQASYPKLPTETFVPKIVSTGKRKKFTPGGNLTGKVKTLEIRCKDLSIHTFSFKFSPKDEAKSTVTAILHHAFPTRLELMFAFEYQDPNRQPGKQTHHTTMFTIKSDWSKELDRLHCADAWRVTQVNEHFNMTDSMPECFVVSSKLYDNDLLKAAPHFLDSRVPAWCYSYKNGTALVRMACLRSESALSQTENNMLEAVRLVHPNKRQAEIADLNKQCPSVKDIANSFMKLKEICMPVSLKEFWVEDLNWFARLSDTGWLQNVTRCLETAVEIVIKMAGDTPVSVVMKESDSKDLCCVISSLVQLMLDPCFRTQRGFQNLVQREWVVMGHPFLDRHGHIKKNEEDVSPVFLMFLDCVWQMLQQFPSAFAFSETYLTTLWDSTFIGLFETFLFNSQHQRMMCSKEGIPYGPKKGAQLLSVWDWSLQFKNEEQSLFKNPLYVAEHEVVKHRRESASLEDSKRSLAEEKGASALESSTEVNKDSSLVRNLGYLIVDDYNDTLQTISKSDLDILLPQVKGPLIKLWSQCFLRWLIPVQIIGGGSPSEYFQQCILVEEILHLKHRVKVLESSQQDIPNDRVRRPKSDLFFSQDIHGVPHKLKADVLTSSFPYLPLGPLNRRNILGTPLSKYFEESMVAYGLGVSENGAAAELEDTDDSEGRNSKSRGENLE